MGYSAVEIEMTLGSSTAAVGRCNKPCNALRYASSLFKNSLCKFYSAHLARSGHVVAPAKFRKCLPNLKPVNHEDCLYHDCVERHAKRRR